MASSTSTASATDPMLLNISTSALGPDADGGVALSACIIKRRAVLKIGIHLNINRIRRHGSFQVIDWMLPKLCRVDRRGRESPVHAMLRSEEHTSELQSPC